MLESKSSALPLGDIPIFSTLILYHTSSRRVKSFYRFCFRTEKNHLCFVLKIFLFSIDKTRRRYYNIKVCNFRQTQIFNQEKNNGSRSDITQYIGRGARGTSHVTSVQAFKAPRGHRLPYSRNTRRRLLPRRSCAPGRISPRLQGQRAS